MRCKHCGETLDASLRAVEGAERTASRRDVAALPHRALGGSAAAHSVGIASLVLGILAFLFAWIPCLGIVSMPVSGLGLVLGIVGMGICVLRKGSGLGFPIAGFAVSFLALAVACIWIGLMGAAKKTVDELISSDRKQQEEGPIIAAEQEAAVGDIRVRISKVWVGPIPTKPKPLAGYSSFLVRLSLRNVGTSQIVKYASWREGYGGSRDTKAKLEDNFGNHYPVLNPWSGPWDRAEDKLECAVDSFRLVPGSECTDLLIFEKPIPNAEWFLLTLASGNIDGKGKTRFKIPASMIQHEDDTKAKDEQKDKERPKPEEPKTAEEKWADTSKLESVRRGDLRVQVTRVHIGKVELKGTLNEKGQSKDELLQIELTIKNLSTTKLIHLKGWGGAEFGGLPKLKDNFDNAYRGVEFGIFNRPVGQIKRTEDIYPGKTAADVLVFDVPVEGVKYLRLSLPCENFGEKGELRFQIPAAEIEGRKKSKAELEAEEKLREAKKREQDEAEVERKKAAEKAEKLAGEKLQQAKELLSKGKDRQAQDWLQFIVNNYPGTKPAAEAQTIMAGMRAEKTAGEKLQQAQALLSKGREDLARDRLQEIVKKYPDTKAAVEAKSIMAEKDAERILRIAKKLLDQDMEDKARKRLQEIVKDYPGTKAAAEAQKLLDKKD
jgi:TolA-binding protein